MIERLLPLLASVLLVGIIAWRVWLQSRRYGSRSVVLFRSQNFVENLRDGLAVALFALLVGQAIVWVLSPETLRPWGAGHSTRAIWEAFGTALLFGGLVLLVAAQLELGASWRIGVDETARPGLVTTGLYRFCRNPIFLALLATWTGYALLLPTTLSFCLLAGGFIGIRQQALLEEAYLTRTYGDAYRDYARRVGRFVPGIGKLR